MQRQRESRPMALGSPEPMCFIFCRVCPSPPPRHYSGVWLLPQSTYFPRDETGLVCLPTQLERTLQHVMRGGGRAPPTLTSHG